MGTRSSAGTSSSNGSTSHGGAAGGESSGGAPPLWSPHRSQSLPQLTLAEGDAGVTAGSVTVGTAAQQRYCGYFDAVAEAIKGREVQSWEMSRTIMQHHSWW